MPAPDRRLPAPLLVIAPVLFVVLSATGPFDGCGGGDDPRPLPPDPSASCFDDDDCVPVGCEDLQCIAGSCTEVAPIRDGDGDGEAPPTCGLDCDDTNASIAPGLRETCDLIDQDCDGAIDEDAAPMAIRFETDTRDPRMLSFPWGPDVLVTDAQFSPGSLLARVVSLDERTVGVSRRVHDLGDVEIIASAGRPLPDGALVALATRAPDGSAMEIAILTIRRAEDGVPELVGDPIVHPVADVTALDVAVLDGAPVIAWDVATTRFLWSPAWPADVMVAEGLVEGLGPLDLATDGTRIAVPSGPRSISFHGADGSALGVQDATGDLALGRPLADDVGGLFAIVRDAFDHSVQRITLGSAGELTPALDAEPMTVSFAADLFGTRLFITRASTTGTIAGFAETSNLEIYSSFGTSEITGPGLGGTVLSVTVLELPSGPVIVTNYGENGSIFTLLACRST